MENYGKEQVYFSSLLAEKFPEIHQKICKILNKHQVAVKEIKNTKDIWCRDYMPVPIKNNKYCWFNYSPSYLKCYEHLISKQQDITLPKYMETQFSDIRLDGGNVIRYKNKAMISDRVYLENPSIANNTLHQKLETLLKADVLIVPAIRSDMTGHTDGMVRFLDNHTIITNCLKHEYKYWQKAMLKACKNHHVELIEIPNKPIKNITWNGARGCYLNYLELNKVIIQPVFNETSDEQVIYTMKDLFPGKIIEPICMNAIADLGGLINCISWNINTSA